MNSKCEYSSVGSVKGMKGESKKYGKQNGTGWVAWKRDHEARQFSGCLACVMESQSMRVKPKSDAAAR